MGIKTAVFLILILTVLAVMQYRWVGKVSRAEADRMASNLETSVARFAEEFDRELTRTFLFFLSNPPRDAAAKGKHFGALLDRWAKENEFADLIKDLYWLEPTDSAEMIWSRFDRQSGDFAACAPLEDETDFFQIQRPSRPRSGPGPRSSRWPVLNGSIPAMQLPTSTPSLWGPPFGLRHRLDRLWHDSRLVITLDLATIRELVLPELMSRHINQGNRSDYRVTVTEATAGPEDAAPVIFRSHSGDDFQNVDVQAGLFGLRHFPELAPLLHGPGRHVDDPSEAARQANRHRRHLGIGERGDGGFWTVSVTHVAGSLEAAVRITRWRNLGFNFAILAVLGASIGLIMRSTQRARNLANQQLEFVAGVSHELLTPLSAIQSAAQNLADGLVANQEKVQAYGEAIRNHGSRLSEMVENVLDFAGIHAERHVFSFQPIVAEKLVDDVIDECRPLLEKSGAHVAVKVVDDVPPMRADPSASRQILRNLISNAAKYGGDKTEIDILISPEADGREVHIRVTDNGPGIPQHETAHVFKPFFRGQAARDSQIQGSGLGLCLVRNMIAAQGGRVSLSMPAEGGCAFTVVWPRDDNSEHPE